MSTLDSAEPSFPRGTAGSGRLSWSGYTSSQAMLEPIRQQFGAAMQSLHDAMQACPHAVWSAEGQPSDAAVLRQEPWYLAFHTIFWLDLYLSENAGSYVPPAPFTRDELEPDLLPARAYSKNELFDWLQQCATAFEQRLASCATDEGMQRACHLQWGEMTAGELLLYNLRHVQHHTAQLNLLIRQAGAEPSRWVMRADGL
ncbi:MAG: hypothetical protein ACI9SE_004405 [Neolewinella sp.]|jgi:hypothetical protein